MNLPRLLFPAAVALLMPDLAAAAIVVDGRADEAEWQQAQRFDQFVATQPLTRQPAPLAHLARLVGTPAGIAVHIEVAQPAGIARVKPRLKRDEPDLAADRINLMLDFNGDGEVGYNFCVALSGTEQDQTITGENRFNIDWDGDWQSAVLETEAGWSVEMLIPWTIAPIKGLGAGRRTIGVYFDRVVYATGERFAYPGASFEQARFMSDFARVEIEQFPATLLHFYPYATVAQDLVGNAADIRAGVDVFWKPSGDFQLTATVNPDFGQVEADELVVDFSAIETFFSDRRPFFTENQSPFVVTLPESGQLIYTRRVGGAADDGDGAAEIAGALKLNGNAGGFDYAAFGASEKGEGGRDFLAGRLNRSFDGLALGTLLTYVDRPFLQREALVAALDYDWRPRDTLRINGALVESVLDLAPLAGGEKRGFGGYANLNWQQTPAFTHNVELVRYDERFDLADFGYVRRVDYRQLEWGGIWRQTGFDADAITQYANWELFLTDRDSDRGADLPEHLFLSRYAQHRNSDDSYAELFHATGGIDDLISRGNGNVYFGPRSSFYAEYNSNRLDTLRFGAELYLFEEGLGGYARELEGSVTWFITERLNSKLALELLDSPDWVIWRSDQRFGRYQRRQAFGTFDLGWIPDERQEFRLKFQWIGLEAEAGREYRIGAGQRLQATGQALPDFGLNNLGLQLRYRYEFRPQSELYVVYSRGGFEEFVAPSEGLEQRFRDALDLRDADQVLVKLRWRF